MENEQNKFLQDLHIPAKYAIKVRILDLAGVNEKMKTVKERHLAVPAAHRKKLE